MRGLEYYRRDRIFPTADENILKADIRASTAMELSVLKERLAGGNEPLSGKIITGTETE
jgi:hypothetical protein